MNKIWAIATHMAAEGVRMRIAAVVIAVYMILMPSLPFLLKGDGTLHGHVQVIITYSLLLASILLSVLTLALSTGSLCLEIRDKQMFLLDTKPVQRWQILAGKWIGVMLINAALLAFMGLSSYGFIRFLASRRGTLEEAQFKAEQDKLHNQVLCARRSFKPPKPDIEKMVLRRLRELKKANRIPEGMTEEEARRLVRSRLLNRLKSVPYGFVRRWKFTGLPVRRYGWRHFTVRFKYYLGNEWTSTEVDGYWRFRAKGAKQSLDVATRFTSGNFHEFNVPLDVVSPKGELVVEFVNTDRHRVSASFPLDDGLELLFPVSGFAANLTRGLILMACKLGFLAAAGLLCSTFLTLPVAVTLALCIYLLSGLSGFIEDMVRSPALFTSLRPNETGQMVSVPTLPKTILKWYLTALTYIMPPFKEFQVVGKLNAGREISWTVVGKAAAIVLLLRGGVLALLAARIFARRELADLKT